MEELRSFAFGPFILDCSRRVLERAGEPVELSSRGFEVLRVLIEARDRVVTRPEILAEVWSGRVVEEHNLSVQMSKLRRALGDPGDSVITTVPGRGYRFVAPVTVLDPPDTAGASATGAAFVRPPASSRRRRALPAIAGICLLAALVPLLWIALYHPSPPPLSIVVMPFRDLSGQPGNQYLADAISDDLTTDLAHLPGSIVIARETADAYAGHAVSAKLIGRALDVRYLLEGSLRVEDTTLHINAQLIDTRGGGHLWSERFDIVRAGLADTRARIVGRIAGALDLALDQVEAARAERERGKDPDAVDLLFRARSRLDHDDTDAGFRVAEALLKRAVALRPDFPEAQATLGLTLLHKIRSTDDPQAQDDQAQARVAVTRALQLAPDNSNVLVALAELQFVDGHYAEAADTVGRVLANDPNDVEASDVLATCAAAQGNPATAADALQSIMRLNPESRRSRIRALRLGTFRLLQGRVVEAEAWLRRAIAGEPDPQPGAADWGYPEEARMLLIATAGLQGRTDQARAMYAAYTHVWPHRTTWRIAALSTRSMSALPGFARMTASLRDAGMPAYADEHVDDGIFSGSTMLPDKSFVPTPRTLTKATTIDTSELDRLIQADKPGLILDLGPGAAVVPVAVWENQSGGDDDAHFVDSTLRTKPGLAPDTSIVVMADGTYGSVSYNAALRLVLLGYTHVIWYRGGEEAWSAAKRPSLDLRQ